MRVYFVEAYSGDAARAIIKIGKARDPVARVQELQIGAPCRLRLLGSVECESDAAALLLERRLHVAFEAQRRNGEWFRLSSSQKGYMRMLISGKKPETRSDDAGWKVADGARVRRLLRRRR